MSPLIRRTSLFLTLSASFLPVVLPLRATENSTPEVAKGKLEDVERLTTPVVDDASDEAKQAIGRMHLPQGFVAHLFAAEPMLANPVAFNFDEQGRLFLAETHRYGSSTLDIRGYMWTLEDDLDNRNQADWMDSIRRNFGPDGVAELSKESELVRLLVDTNGDGTADKSTIYADDFRTPQDGVAAGVLPYRGNVWFTNIPALWKLTGRDKAETREILHKGYGVRFNFTGHDLHGLILGPDGRIYYSIGDRGAHVDTKEGGVVDTPDSGAVFRCWPDGTGLELFATGLRNPQSLAFNEYGDLFTGDNDSDQGDEERLVHLVEGGDSGWRIGYQFAPRGNAGPWNAEKLWKPRDGTQPSYLLSPICNIEDGPSGIAYYPGTGLTPAYLGYLFITHFKGSISNSGIFAYKMKPAGASYAIETAAPFLTGALPTDVRFAPDGKLFYSDWAEGWPKSRRGRIYSIYDPNFADAPGLKSVEKLIGSDFSKKKDDELADLLGHADWRIRLEAQYTLATRGAAGIAKFSAAVAGANTLARRHAVWGLGQIARKDPAALDALRPLLAHEDSEVRAQAANTLGDLRDAASADALVNRLFDDAVRVRFFAAQALAKLKDKAALPSLISAVRANNDSDTYLRHALVLALASCAGSDQLAAKTADDSVAVRRAAVLALRRQQSPMVAAFLSDSDASIVRETALAINDAPIPGAYADLAALGGNAPSDEAIGLRVLNAHFRLGTAKDADALARIASGGDPAVLRTEALSLLSLWPQPPQRDRIVGIFRPFDQKTRPAEIAAEALKPQLRSILAPGTLAEIQLAALNAIEKLGLKDSALLLATVVTDKAQPGDVRSAALNTLDALKAPGLQDIVALAASSESSDLRIAALPISTRLNPDVAIAQLTGLVEHGSVSEKQTAYKALGTLADPRADELLLQQLTLLAADKIAPPVQLDLLEAAGMRGDPRVKQVLADRDAAIAKNPDPLAPFQVCLEGGNVRRAYQIFQRDPVMQCMRCHSIGSFGTGEAGPNLAGVASRHDREYLLESIIKPSAKIAKGFEIVTVTKANGDVVTGTLLDRDDNGVQVRTGEDATVTIPTAQVKEVVSAPSAMPELAAMVLTKSQIRDLVAALATLTDDARMPGADTGVATDKASMRALRGIETPAH